MPKTYINVHSALLVACLTAVQRIACIFIIAYWFGELLPASLLAGVACCTAGVLLQLQEQVSKQAGTHEILVPSSDPDTIAPGVDDLEEQDLVLRRMY